MRLPGEIVRSISPLVLFASGLYTGDKEGAQSNGSRKISETDYFPDVCPYCEGTLAFSASLAFYSSPFPPLSPSSVLGSQHRHRIHRRTRPTATLSFSWHRCCVTDLDSLTRQTSWTSVTLICNCFIFLIFHALIRSKPCVYVEHHKLQSDTDFAY